MKIEPDYMIDIEMDYNLDKAKVYWKISAHPPRNAFFKKTTWGINERFSGLVLSAK